MEMRWIPLSVEWEERFDGPPPLRYAAKVSAAALDVSTGYVHRLEMEARSTHDVGQSVDDLGSRDLELIRAQRDVLTAFLEARA